MAREKNPQCLLTRGLYWQNTSEKQMGCKDNLELSLNIVFVFSTYCNTSS